jgi:lipoprotein-releasing system permease protein
MAESGRLFRTSTWYGMEENQYGSFRTTKSLLVMIMVLIVAVATVNVSSAMVMIVLEKTQEIGILKGIGASPTAVSLSFVITGFVTGAFGAVIGIAVGLLVSVNINQVIRGIDALLNGSIAAFRWLAKPFGLGHPAETVRIMDPAFYLETIPIRINWLEITGVAFLAVFLATAASLLPARRAGRIRPMDVLRKV